MEQDFNETMTIDFFFILDLGPDYAADGEMFKDLDVSTDDMGSAFLLEKPEMSPPAYFAGSVGLGNGLPECPPAIPSRIFFGTMIPTSAIRLA
jgi:hypothetical protein